MMDLKTVSLTVIMFELTGTLEYIIPCMITLMAAKITGDAIVHGGIADHLIKYLLNKLPFLDPREEVEALEGLKAGSVGVRWGHGLSFFKSVEKVENVERALNDEQFSGFPIVTSGEERFVVGFVGREEVRAGLGRAYAGRILNPSTPVLFERAAHNRRRGS
ncbi:glycerol ethanol, ferric requiring protein, partial [Rhizophlyctis rosea]